LAFFSNLSSFDNSKEDGYNGYYQKNMNDTPGTVSKKANRPKDKK